MNIIESLINERYRINSILGQGGMGITYHAEHLNSSTKVAIKILSLDLIDDWKKLDYFEREVKILQQLDHPKIPKYIDYFVSDQDNYYQINPPSPPLKVGNTNPPKIEAKKVPLAKGDLGGSTNYKIDSENSLQDLIAQGVKPDRFYLVQELIEGKSLFHLIEDGWKPDEKEVKHIATQILKILVYLQELIPPVVHRDIKPQNLIYTENREVFLVDFGAVQDQVRQSTYASSVVGTYGYMAIEQFRGGKTYPSTDLYGLGATLIYLLTQKHPSDLPQKRLKIDWQNEVKISTDFRNWLDKLIEPNHQNRIPSAQIALDVLSGKLALKKETNNYQAKPIYTSIRLIKTKDELNINIPCALSRKRFNYGELLRITCYLITLLIILLLIWTLPSYLRIIVIIFSSYPLCSRILKNRILRTLVFIGWLVIFSITSLILFLNNMTNLLIPRLGCLFTCLLVTIHDLILGEISVNSFKELFFNTELIINKNKGAIIKQKPRTLFQKSQKIASFSSSYFDEHKKDLLTLLTKAERRWLQQEIDSFL